MREDYDFSLSTENPYAQALRKEATKELSEMPPSDHLLASTAHWTAAVRAQESTRQDRLFDDPWAAALAGPEGATWIEQSPSVSTVPMVLRTRFFDDFVQRIAAQDRIRQIMLMAAGLAEHGWQATLTQAGAPDASHGRWTLSVIPTTMPNFPHNWVYDSA